MSRGRKKGKCDVVIVGEENEKKGWETQTTGVHID